MLYEAVKDKVSGAWDATKDFCSKNKKVVATVAVVGAAVVVPELVMAADLPTAMPTASTDVAAAIDDAKKIGYGALGMLIVLFVIKLWKRVFGGA